MSKKLSSHICAVLQEDENKDCNPFSFSMTDGLIRVASTRIFADPEQSFLELAANSVDAYRQIKGEKSIGKFGMGFYSIFYWLYSEPGSIININTRYLNSENRVVSYSISFNHGDQGLTFKGGKEIIDDERPRSILYLHNVYERLKKKKEFSYLYGMFDNYMDKEKSYTNTGTRVTLKYKFDDIFCIEQQFDKLKYIKGVVILVAFGNTMFTHINNMDVHKDSYVPEDLVLISIYSEKLEVVDFAGGITKDLILKTMIIPSVSSKPRVSKPSYTMLPTTRYIDFSPNKNKVELFSIIVGGVVVYKSETIVIVGGCTPYIYNVNFPAESPLPVSRDDIILSDEVVESFMKQLYKILEYCIKFNGLDDFLDALMEYAKYSPQVEAKQIFNVARKYVEYYPSIVLYNYSTDYGKIISDLFTHDAKVNIVRYKYASIYRTEKDLHPHMEKLTLPEEYFHLKKVVHVDIDVPVNSSRFLFINTHLENWCSRVIISNPTCILHSIESSIKESSFGEDFDVGSTTRLYANILYSTWTAVTQSLKVDNVTRYIKKMLDVVKILTPDDIDEFIIAFNSKISEMKFNFVYGGSYEVILNDGSCPGFQGSWYEYGIYNGQKAAEHTKELMHFYLDILELDVRGSHSYWPRFENFIIFNHKITPATKNRKELEDINEHKIAGLNMCIERTEKLIFNNTFEHLYNEDYGQIPLIKIVPGVTKFIVNEIQRRGGKSLYKMIEAMARRYMIGSELHAKVIKPVRSSARIFSERSTKRMFSFEPVKTFIRANQLIAYLYSKPPDVEMLDIKNIIENASKYDGPDLALQTISIAVNEGTTKNFGASVITELLQNSVDASRQNGVNDPINIDVYTNGVRVKDTVGISYETLVYILIPFVSSKKESDANVTGEMGTGFFNVFRQPWVETVVITTTYGRDYAEIIAKPIVKDGMVIDILYMYTFEPAQRMNNETCIYVYINDDIELRTQLQTDVNLQINNYLKYVDYPIHLNDKVVANKYKYLIFENEIGTVYVTHDKDITSFIMTNGVPFTDYADFVVNYKSFNKAFIKISSMRIIIDLKKTVYRPSQSRTKISLKSMSNDDFGEFLNKCSYRSSLYIYSMVEYPYQDIIIPFSSSTTFISQLKLTSTDYGKYHLQDHNFPFIHRWVDDDSNIATKINIRISEILDNKEITRYEDFLMEEVIETWFIGKILRSNKVKEIKVVKLDKSLRSSKRGLKTHKDIISDVDVDLAVDIECLQVFVKEYWNMLIDLSGGYKFKGVVSNNECPRIVCCEISEESVPGFYLPKTHMIVLNSKMYDHEEITECFYKYTQMYKDNKLKALDELRLDPVFSNLISPSIPAPILLHELLHAVTGSSHNGTHDTPYFTVNGTHGTFDEIATKLYIMLCGEGIIDNVMKKSKTKHLSLPPPSKTSAIFSNLKGLYPEEPWQLKKKRGGRGGGSKGESIIAPSTGRVTKSSKSIIVTGLKPPGSKKLGKRNKKP
jgi:hypothetical protein